MVHDALNSDQSMIRVLVADSSRSDGKIQEIVKIAKQKGVSVEWVNQNSLIKMSESGNPQGVMAEMNPITETTLEAVLRKERNAFVLLLNHIDYEQNLGAILRSAWAAGVDAVVAAPNGVHELTPVVAKISMGGAAYVPLIGMSLFQATDLLNKYAVPVVGVEVNMGETYTEANMRGPIAFMMGGEAVGLSEPLQKVCDRFINIPMVSGVASLNVSVASALVMFEKVRQERNN